MLVIELLNAALHSAGGCTSPDIWSCGCSADWGAAQSQGAVCPGATLTAVAASFQTQGIWILENLVNEFLYQGLHLWAPLLYIFAAAGGLISLALGAPPKMYLWFFLGPAIYDWLLDTTYDYPVHGAEWRIADKTQNQREVWKLAEAGLANIVKSASPAVSIYRSDPPTRGASVPLLYVWFDEIVSDVVQGMVGWTGIYDHVSSGASPNSNLHGTPSVGENRWYLLSNLKWSILQNITGATLKSPELRDSFVTFLASECGDNLKRAISQQDFIAVATAQGANLGPSPSVMVNYPFLTQLLNTQNVPTPRSLKRVLGDTNPGSFRGFNALFGSGAINWWGVQDRLNCDAYMWLLIQAFRWESGHIFFQLIKSVPGGMSVDDVTLDLFYGWDIRTPPPSSSPISTPEERRIFVQNLILLHLFRNELAKAPALVDQRFSTSSQAESIAKGYQRDVGTKAKYAELYTWAMMIPYLQGVLLYMLSIGYPIACVLVIIPGMHKTMFTWMSFWAWVKLWDLGFALCMLIERSLWAMLGNSSNAARIHQYITEMSNWGYVKVSCPGISTFDCSIPKVEHDSWFFSQSWENAIKTFDRALVLAANLDLDLQNSYYIYIMAALYFAVPAVTGQLVLGARAGAASMVNTAIGGAAQEIGKTAATAHQSDVITQLKANEASVGQAAYTKALRQSGLGAKAIEYGNQGMREDMAASAIGTAKSAEGSWMQNRALENQDFRANAGVWAAAATGIAKQYPQGGPQPVGTTPPSSQSTTQTADPAATASGIDNPKNPALPVGSTPSAKAPAVPAKEEKAPLPGPTPKTTDDGKVKHNPWDPRGLAEKFNEAVDAVRNDPVGSANGALKFASQHGAPLLEAAAAAGIAKNSNAMYADQAAAHGLQADMDIASFRHGGEGKGFNAAASRTGEYANFDAEMARWDAMNSFASNVSGMSAGVYGTFAGNFSPPAKPTQSMNALAMDGLLNTKDSDTRASANFVNPTSGGYRMALHSTASALQGSMGGQHVMGAYQSWTPTDAMGYSLKAGAQMAGSDVYGGDRDGVKIIADTKGGRSGVLSEQDTGRGSSPVAPTSGMGENHRESLGANPTDTGTTVAGNLASSTGATQYGPQSGAIK